MPPTYGIAIGMTTATPAGQIVAYVRLSTGHQSLDEQHDALAALSPVKVFEDKVTGRTMARPGWEQCCEYLRPGDTLAVVGLGRLGRSALEVIETVNELAAAGIVVQSLREGILDPSSATGSLMISMFAALAQFEVDLKAERAAAARASARLRWTTDWPPEGPQRRFSGLCDSNARVGCDGRPSVREVRYSTFHVLPIREVSGRLAGLPSAPVGLGLRERFIFELRYPQREPLGDVTGHAVRPALVPNYCHDLPR